jgi:hypothetical protein
VPLKRDGKIVAAKLVVHVGEDDEYFTFISSEAYELEKWKQYRIQSGELVAVESCVMGNIWNRKEKSMNTLPCNQPTDNCQYSDTLTRVWAFRRQKWLWSVKFLC